MMPCPQCHAYVWCERTAYPDVVYYRCKPRNHRFEHKLDSGDKIEGDKPIMPKGFDDDE